MIRRDPLFKGCTRPAMALGVPLTPLVVTCGLIVLLAIWINLLLALLMVPAILIMRGIAKQDDQQFRLLWLKMWCRLLPNYNANSKFWKASTYSPVEFIKRK